MRRFENRLEYASKMIENYDSQEPFANYLKEVFKANKQFGSKDRKFYKAACFSFFRLGQYGLTLDLKQRILLGLYFTGEGFSLPDFEEVYQVYFDMEADDSKSLKEKFDSVATEDTPFDKLDVYPFTEETCSVIEIDAFIDSVFEPRPIWLRFAKEEEEKSKAIFVKNGLDIQMMDNYPYLKNGVSLNFVQNLPYEVQDIGSQKILDSLEIKNEGTFWDCCAGAGGKSLQLAEKFDGIKLYTSDLRLKALQNLLKRYEKYSYPKPMLSVTDLEKEVEAIHFAYDNENELINHGYFDTIFIDAPCTGSGTWASTPENLTSFDTTDIYLYAEKQFSIVKNALPFLKEEGKLIYVTCSIFTKENEEVQAKITKELGLKCTNSFYIKGYEMQGDNFFIAEFSR